MDDKVVGLGGIVALNDAIQAGEAKLVKLAALGFNGILDRAVAEFLSNEVLRTRSDARLHIRPRKTDGGRHQCRASTPS